MEDYKFDELREFADEESRMDILSPSKDTEEDTEDTAEDRGVGSDAWLEEADNKYEERREG